MAEPTKRYWMSLAELSGNGPVAEGEFSELLPLGPSAPPRPTVDFSRRDFFRIMGLSASAATLACSRAPTREAIPYTLAPEDSTPGVAAWYASTCGACPSACGILARTREGRPVKLEGNDSHPWSRGGLCATGQASILSLYDAGREHGPLAGGVKTSWDKVDAEVQDALRRASESGTGIRLVVPLQVGPTAEVAIARFLAAYPSARLVLDDPLGLAAIADAQLGAHRLWAIPAFHFDRARVVVSFDADFLGTWLSPVAFTKQLAEARHAKDQPRLFQLEPTMTVTGASADVRWTLAPTDVVPALAALAKRLGIAVAAPAAELAAERLDRLAAELSAHRGESLVVTGSTEPAAQALAVAINEALGNTGRTVAPSEGIGSVSPAVRHPMTDLLDELARGRVEVLVFLGGNPIYSSPHGEELARLLDKVALTVSTADRRDETGAQARYLAPDHHFLESWGDSEPIRGLLGLSQPAVAPLYDTRSAYESLLVWAGAGQRYYDFLRTRWEREVFPRTTGGLFQTFWDASVQAGFAAVTSDPIEAHYVDVSQTAMESYRAPAKGAQNALALVPYASVGLRNGQLANNGWLQELPDPLTKVTWGNVAQLAPQTAAQLGLADGDLITIAAGERRVTLPVLQAPGIHPGVVGVALGYGRTHAGPIGNGVGARVVGLGGAGTPVTIARAGGRIELARTQTHASMEGRPLVRDLEPGKDKLEPIEKQPQGNPSMWSGHEYPGHRWAMAIDLSACTGCSACHVACQAENNISVVGVDEVRNRREMHWMRIDRYFAGSPEEPEVAFQPMLCQHCENAPCETVCPVLATVHSSEGLNQQVYNRCVGTRYCANNCPTKVRRFNWFDYPHDPTERLVLNPDVVVRSRGVMEKCSFCVQRIQAGKAQAKVDGRALADGEVKTACQQSCPADAIVFGDLNDKGSRVAKLVESGRAYTILEELHIEPSVHYLARSRNPGGRA